jgi:hypothetical protein
MVGNKDLPKGFIDPKRGVVVAMKIGAVKPGSVAAEGGRKREREGLFGTALGPFRSGGKGGGSNDEE